MKCNLRCFLSLDTIWSWKFINTHISDCKIFSSYSQVSARFRSIGSTPNTEEYCRSPFARKTGRYGMLSLKRVFHRLLGEGGCDEPKESPLRRLGFSRASKSARKWTKGWVSVTMRKDSTMFRFFFRLEGENKNTSEGFYPSRKLSSGINGIIESFDQKFLFVFWDK